MNQSGRILHQVERNRTYARHVRTDKIAQSIHQPSNSRPNSGGVSTGWGVEIGNVSGAAHLRPHSAMSLCELGVALKVSEPNTPTRTLALVSHQTSGVVTPVDHCHQPALNSTTASSKASSSIPPHVGNGRPPSPYRRSPSVHENSADGAKHTIAQLRSRLASLEGHVQQIQTQKRLLVVQNRKYRALIRQMEGCNDDLLRPASPQGNVDEDGAENRSTSSSPTHALDPAADAVAGSSDVEGAVLRRVSDLDDAIEDVPEAYEATIPTLEHVMATRGPNRPASAGQASLLDLSERQSCASAQQAAGEQLDRERQLVESALGDAASNKFAFAVEVRCEEDLKELLLQACGKLLLKQQNLRRPSSPTLSGSLPPRVASTVVSDEHGEEHQQHDRSLHHHDRSAVSSSAVFRRPSSIKEVLDELKATTSMWENAATMRLDSGLQLSLTLLQQLRVWSSSCETLVECMERTKDLAMGHAGEHPQVPYPDSEQPLTLSALGKALDECLSVVLQLTRHSMVAVDVVEKNHVALQKSVVLCHGDSDKLFEDEFSDEDFGEGKSTKKSKPTHDDRKGRGAARVGGRSSSHRNATSDSRKQARLSSVHRVGSAEHRVMKKIDTSVATLRGDISNLQQHCREQLQRILRDSATDDDLLCVYRREIANAAARCAQSHEQQQQRQQQQRLDDTPPVVHESSLAARQRVGSADRSRHSAATIDIGDDDMSAIISKTAPTATSTSSRPGSGSTAGRPRSTPGRHRSNSPLGTNAAPPSSSIPPIVGHLIRCVNTVHIAFMEIVFGPVRNTASFKSLQEQKHEAVTRQRRAGDIEAALQSADGGPPLSMADGNEMVLVRRSANIQRKCNDEGTIAGDPAVQRLIQEHMNVLPGTYGALIARNISEIQALPIRITEQDEQDLIAHSELVQRLLEVGLLWGDAFRQEEDGADSNAQRHQIRVHHCTDFLELIRRSKPMVSAFFFHDAKLQKSAVEEVTENAASCFSDALRGVVGSGGGRRRSDLRKKTAVEILSRVRMLHEGSQARAKLNWRGLLTLHKHFRMRQLLMQALRCVALSSEGGGPLSVESNEHLVGNLRRLVSAFYTDLGIKLDAEQRLLKSSLRITIEAVWSDLLALLRNSADLCFATGVNVEVLEVLGPAYHTVLTEGMRHFSVQAVPTSTVGNAEIVLPTKSTMRSSQSVSQCEATTTTTATAAAMSGSNASGGGGGVCAADEEDEDSSSVSRFPSERVAEQEHHHHHHHQTSAESWLGLCISKTTKEQPSPSPNGGTKQQQPAATRVGGGRPSDGRLRPLRPQTTTLSAAYHQEQQRSRTVTEKSSSPTRVGRTNGGAGMFRLAPAADSGNAVSPVLQAHSRKMYSTGAVLSKENPWLNWKQ